MKNICVYCGSNFGRDESYKREAVHLAKCLLERGLGLVYGGSNIGLMGTLAEIMTGGNGHVTGVIPKGLFPKKFANTEINDCILTEDMYERKKTMAKLADGVIALPGGIGTFEELFEILSLTQLGVLKKPIGILNINHFYDPFVSILDRAISEEFMRDSNRKLYMVSESPEEILTFFENYAYPELDNKWRETENKDEQK